MTSTNCFDSAGPLAGGTRGDGDLTDADLERDGWERCFVADEPRLSEAVEIYRDIGCEVLLQPVREDGDGCTDCMRCEPGRFRVIYVRKPPADDRVE